MPKPYDTTARQLLAAYPEAWLEYLRVEPDGPVRVLSPSLPTVSPEADMVYRVEGPRPYLVHVEMQAGRDRTLPRRLLRYNVLLDDRHDLRARSIAVLLRPEADADDLTGVLEHRLPDGRRVLEFHYQVVRAWEQSAAALLAGDVGTLPMAPLGDVPRAQVPEVLRHIDARLLQEAPTATAGTIMEMSLWLSGLRLPRSEIDELRGRLRSMFDWMKESSYAQVLLEEGMARGMAAGQVREARKVVLRLGQARFGPPDEETRSAIEAIDDLGRLEELSLHLLGASGWAELLAES
jgi:predicted transposase YdaD